MTSAPQNGLIAGINVTPLVDISLVLLIIFIVTAKLVVTPAVPLQLPTAAAAQEVQVVFSVAVPTDGPVVVNGTAVAGDPAFVRLAADALASHGDLRVVISADTDAHHGRVIHVLDLLARAGVTRIAFAALPPEGSGR
ncbi:MAG: ExbD/TolR family protein [Polyangia bacterium]